MKLVNPRVNSSQLAHERAPALVDLKNKTIGLLSNRKLNADLLLQETADCLKRRHGGKVLDIRYVESKCPCTNGNTTGLSPECDYLLRRPAIEAVARHAVCMTVPLLSSPVTRGVLYETLHVTARNIARVLGLPDYPSFWSIL